MWCAQDDVTQMPDTSAGTSKPVFFSVLFQDLLLLLVSSASQWNIVHSGLTSQSSAGTPRARPKLAVILNGRPGSGMCYFQYSLLVETSPDLRGGKINPISQ